MGFMFAPPNAVDGGAKVSFRPSIMPHYFHGSLKISNFAPPNVEHGSAPLMRMIVYTEIMLNSKETNRMILT